MAVQVEHVGNDYMVVSGYVLKEEGEKGVGEEDRRASCAHMAVLALRMVQEAQVVVASSQARLCLSVGIAAGPVVLDSRPSAFFLYGSPQLSLPVLSIPPISSGPLVFFSLPPAPPSPTSSPCLLRNPVTSLPLPSTPVHSCPPPSLSLPPFMCFPIMRKKTGPTGYSTLTTTKWAGVEYDRAEPAVPALIRRHGQHGSAPLLLRRPLAGGASGRLDNEGDAAVWHGAGERGSEAS